ncbi:hypothetical protein EB796_008146 [Bugula neritina]|uniref:CTHRC1 C-terminal domain-containing protein n=1 Tax=Bugula neritina TaxID=10212 RepID=A0A7J7K5R7_BUGNE|nr:hypothetical protein EB796_008146 [Bugula neritina]
MCVTVSVSGVCQNISAGSLELSYAIEPCTGISASDALTGWGSSFNVFIEELRLSEVKVCGGSSFNCE